MSPFGLEEKIVLGKKPDLVLFLVMPLSELDDLGQGI